MDPSTAAVAQLFDPNNLQVRTDVPLADAGKLRVGQQALVQFDSLPGQTVRGRVLRLVQQADIAKNTLQAKVLLENPPLGLVPDMLARVRIFLDSAPAPTSAVSAVQGAHAGLELGLDVLLRLPHPRPKAPLARLALRPTLRLARPRAPLCPDHKIFTPSSGPLLCLCTGVQAAV
jgi:hypothetical protein